MRYIVAAIVATVLMFVGAFVYRTGYFKSVEITIHEDGPFLLLYKEYVGPYHKILPSIEEVEHWALAQKVDCPYTFGMFLDDPQTIEEGRLRSHVGCLVRELPKQIPGDYATRVIAKQRFVMAEFSGAPGIGPMKVYPRVYDFIHEHGLKQNMAPIETYEVKSQLEVTTRYYFGVEN